MEEKKETGIIKILDKANVKTPLLKELESDLTDEAKDQLLGFATSERTQKMLNVFITDMYAQYGDKYMIVIKGNKKINQYVVSLIKIEDVENFNIKEGSVIKSFSITQLSGMVKDFIK